MTEKNNSFNPKSPPLSGDTQSSALSPQHCDQPFRWLITGGWHSVPLSSFRLNNIRTEYVFDMQPIMEVSGPLPYNLKTGVERTIEWLREMEEI